ncbi:MAG: hypothetical protein RIF46_03190 [Cyclobacteriaceae bacterium]
MSQTRKFRTKNGFCHVMDDRIVFTHSGLYGQLGDIAGQGNMARLLILFGGFTVIAAVFSYVNYVEGQLVWAALFGAIGAYLFYGIANNLNTTIHPILLRDQIIEIKYTKSKGILSYPYFEVRFKDEKGRVRKRLITLPRANRRNAQGIREAVQFMSEEGLIS